MTIQDLELRNTPSPTHPVCGWNRCKAPANHFAEFQVVTARGPKLRRMGLCDQCRGTFKRKFLPKAVKKEHAPGVVRAL